MSDCLTQIRSTIGCRTPSRYPIFSTMLVKPDNMSVTRITDSSYENVKSVESNLKQQIERDRLAAEKAELERVSVEKGELFKRFVSQVIRDKQIQSDILETEKALRISESEQVRELEICLKTQQETIESLKADKKGLEEDLYGARALLNVSNNTIANLEFQLEQERIQNREVPEKLEDSDASINSWSSETEVPEETNKCYYTVSIQWLNRNCRN